MNSNRDAEHTVDEPVRTDTEGKADYTGRTDAERTVDDALPSDAEPGRRVELLIDRLVDPGELPPEAVTRSLIDLVRANPDLAESTVERLRGRYEDDGPNEADEDVLYAITRLAAASPDAVDDATVEMLSAHLLGDRPHAIRSVAEILATVLEPADPRLLETVDGLVERFGGDAQDAGRAIQSLGPIGLVHPDPVVERIVDWLRDAEGPPARYSLRTLSALADEHGDRIVPYANVLVSLLDSEDEPTVRYAAQTLAGVVRHDPTAAGPALSRHVGLLESDSDAVRRATVRLFVELGRTAPEDVADLVSALVGLLEDDQKLIRRDACYLLGVLRAEAAREAIVDAHEDGDLEFEAVATAALERIDGEETEPPLPSLDPGAVFLSRRGRE